MSSRPLRYFFQLSFRTCPSRNLAGEGFDPRARLSSSPGGWWTGPPPGLILLVAFVTCPRTTSKPAGSAGITITEDHPSRELRLQNGAPVMLKSSTMRPMPMASSEKNLRRASTSEVTARSGHRLACGCGTEKLSR